MKAGDSAGHFDDVSVVGVVSALISSMFVLALWALILIVEAKKNGMAVTEYIPVVFRGSFSFVPFLPAIERGTENGQKVNWTYYKMSTDGIGHVAKAFTSYTCKLDTVKVSLYTLGNLHRFGCRYFGAMLQSSPIPVKIVVSRLEEDVRALFKKFDIDESWSFDFHEFVRVCLVMQGATKQACMAKEVKELYLSLADSLFHQVATKLKKRKEGAFFDSLLARGGWIFPKGPKPQLSSVG